MSLTKIPWPRKKNHYRAFQTTKCKLETHKTLTQNNESHLNAKEFLNHRTALLLELPPLIAVCSQENQLAEIN